MIDISQVQINSVPASMMQLHQINLSLVARNRILQGLLVAGGITLFILLIIKNKKNDKEENKK